MENNLIERLKAEKLNIPEFLSKLKDGDLYKLSLESFKIPQQVQELVLKQIVETSRDTEFGRKHKFKEIKNSEDYRRQVPLSQWADYEEYSELMAEGKPDILFPGKSKCFIKTSGTTANKPKMIPESELGAKAKQIVTRLRFVEMVLSSPEIRDKGYLLPLSNTSELSTTSGGIPVGYASGFTLAQSMEGALAARMAFPVNILANEDSETLNYLLMRFAMQHKDVVAIFGNNAGRIKELASFAAEHADEIIKDIQTGTIDGARNINPGIKRNLEPILAPDKIRASELRMIKEKTGTLLPKDYWPSLKLLAFWLSSSIGQYIKDVKPIMPDSVKYFDMGYGASEGKFSIPSKGDLASGALSLFTAFYEFLPEGGGSAFMSHELEDNRNYELLITTWSGLYRYNMRDVVKVEGFTGNTPNIVFQYKSGEILNIADEKIPASIINETIREVGATLNIDILQLQVFANQDERCYICYIEPIKEITRLSATALEHKAHEKMCARSFTYEFYCVKQKMMNSLKIVIMKQGWQNHLYKTKTLSSISIAQIKLPVMIKQKAESEWIKGVF